MKVFLFGGAFDPPHLGHQKIVDELLDSGIADRVWYVPVGSHAFDKQMTPAKHRLAMLELIQRDGTRIETFEIDQANGVNYTYDTLKALAKKYPQHEFSWVIGSDNLRDFHKWGDGRSFTHLDMVKAFPFYVYPRKGYSMNPLYEGMIPLTNVDEIDISSTEVRTFLKQHKNVNKFVSPEINQYIEKLDLYL